MVGLCYVLRLVRGEIFVHFHIYKMSARRKEGEEEGGVDGRRKRRGTGKDNHDGAISMSVSLSTMVTSQYIDLKTTHLVYFLKV